MTKQQSQQSSGEADTNASGNSEKDSNSNDKVSYETYQKSVNAEKSAKERAKALEAENKAFRDAEAKRNEDEANKKGDFENLLKIKEEKLLSVQKEKEDAIKEAQELKSAIDYSRKVSAFKAQLPAPLQNDELLHLIDFDNVVIVEGKVDADSVAKVAKGFIEKHSYALKQTGRAMGNAQASGKATLSYEEWTKLSPREMVKRMKEVPKN